MFYSSTLALHVPCKTRCMICTAATQLRCSSCAQPIRLSAERKPYGLGAESTCSQGPSQQQTPPLFRTPGPRGRKGREGGRGACEKPEKQMIVRILAKPSDLQTTRGNSSIFGCISMGMWNWTEHTLCSAEANSRPGTSVTGTGTGTILLEL